MTTAERTIYKIFFTDGKEREVSSASLREALILTAAKQLSEGLVDTIDKAVRRPTKEESKTITDPWITMIDRKDFLGLSDAGLKLDII